MRVSHCNNNKLSAYYRVPGTHCGPLWEISVRPEMAHAEDPSKTGDGDFSIPTQSSKHFGMLRPFQSARKLCVAGWSGGCDGTVVFRPCLRSQGGPHEK